MGRARESPARRFCIGGRAKQLGAAITSHKVKDNLIAGEEDICDEHVTNMKLYGPTVLSRRIVLEALEGEEGIK